MVQLSPHFSLAELTHSDTAIRRGIDQTPPPVILKNLRYTAEQMEQVRALLGKPITVNSGYRSPALNKAVGGSITSAHLQGLAVDFTCKDFGSPQVIVRALAKYPNLDFDQIIYEGTWVHIGFKQLGPRREILTAHFQDGKVTYTKGVA